MVRSRRRPTVPGRRSRPTAAAAATEAAARSARGTKVPISVVPSSSAPRVAAPPSASSAPSPVAALELFASEAGFFCCFFGFDLLLYKLQLLRLEQLLWHALRTGLGAEEELPQLLAERGSVLVEEPGQLDLEAFDIGVSGTVDQVEYELNDDVVFCAENLCDFSCYPFLHDLEVDLGHVDLLVEFRRELGRLEQPCVHAGSHDAQTVRGRTWMGA